MKLKPLHDHVLLKRKQHEEKTAGGLYIPDTAKEKPIEGEVIAVGPGRLGKNGEYQKLDVKVGDLVLFGKYTGNEVKMDGQEYLLVRENDILGVIQR